MYAARIMKCNHGLGRYKENLTLIESLLPFNKKKEYAFLFMPLYTAAKKTALALNNYKEAYRFQELEHALVDSVNTRKNEDNAAALREEYKTKIQADQIELLKREKQINELTDHKKTTTIYALAGGIALILLLALLIVRQLHLKRKIAEEKQKTEEQKALQFRLKALSAQMNPHFIFNALNSIQHFISNNDIKSSKEYLAKFAKLMRKTLDNSVHDTIPLDQELEALTEYMELEKIRTSNQFDYKINIDPNLQSEQVEVPPLLFQPYVENAIWHGISHKMNSDGLIIVTLSQKEGKLSCTIEDNGIGIKKSQEKNAGKHKSLGTSITQTRVDLLNSVEENQIAVKVTDRSELNAADEGTRIELSLPFN
jgi:LytS/YehU family sensor histidine kinase